MKKAILAAALLLPSCAMIEHGTKQNINVSLLPPVKASCNIAGSGFTQNFEPPTTLTVSRSQEPMVIICHPADGSPSGKMTVYSRVENLNLIGDAVFTVGMGAVVDHNAGYDYPENIVIRPGANDSAIKGEYNDNTYYNQ